MMKSLLTSKEASKYLGLQEEELEELVSTGKVPSYKIGGIYTRFKVDDLNYYLRRGDRRGESNVRSSFSERVKDFLYFNDFYIFSSISIALILYFIFK